MMKWYTLKWESAPEGCIVEHFLTQAMAERREKEVRQLSEYAQTFAITEHSVKNRRELVEWLNKFYDKENG